MTRIEQPGNFRPYHGAVNHATRWVRAGTALAIITVLGWVGGCSDNSAGPVDPPPHGVIVSDPVLAVGAAASAAPVSALASAGDQVAYVSLAPGTVPTGTSATIRRVGGAGEIVTTLLNGGFDPVPVDAGAGDAIDIIVRDAAGSAVLEARLAVAAARPPIVVRTDPPRRKTHVPLNAPIVVVFSEPVDPSTLTGSSVQLLRATAPVAGQLRFADSAHLTAMLVPAAPLAPTTAYRLVVTQGIRDLDSQLLEAAVTVEFTTGTAPGAVASVAVDQPALTLAPGETVRLTARAYDSAGTELAVSAVTWTSGDATVAAVSTEGAVTGLSLGATTATATVEQKSASATINIAQLVFASVSAGPSHTCGLTFAGLAYCWGYNWGGMLGTGDTISRATPQLVAGGLAWASLSVGEQHTCGLTLAGEAYCWGNNGSGALGDGSTTSRSIPVPVQGGLTFAAITAGGVLGGGYTCGLMRSGAAYCWGTGGFGQLGNGMGYTDSTNFRSTTTPVAVVGGFVFASLSAGGDATCGVTLDGAAYCWGFGSALGHAATDVCSGYNSDLPPSVQCSFRPVAVAGGLIFASLSVGWQGACGITTTGRAYCWGMYPATAGQSATPVEVSGGLSFADVSMGIGAPNGPTCGVTSDGAIYCWGWLVVRAGSTWVDIEPTNEPSEVSGGLTFGSVSAGGYHICGMTLPGAVYCWGWGGQNGLIGSMYGLLGTASGSINSLAPAKVAGQP